MSMSICHFFKPKDGLTTSRWTTKLPEHNQMQQAQLKRNAVLIIRTAFLFFPIKHKNCNEWLSLSVFTIRLIVNTEREKSFVTIFVFYKNTGVKISKKRFNHLENHTSMNCQFMKVKTGLLSFLKRRAAATCCLEKGLTIWFRFIWWWSSNSYSSAILCNTLPVQIIYKGKTKRCYPQF